MRLALSLAAVVLIASGCRPMDVGAPITEAADQSATGQARGVLRLAPLRVIDGDTFEVDGETVRIANIDTPEMAPRSKCLAEAQLAEVAKRSLEDALGSTWGERDVGLAPTLQREGRDRYGRTLARVRLTTGEDVGDLMIARGYAVRWGGRRAQWCGA
jgi:micrococcal nuclease